MIARRTLLRAAGFGMATAGSAARFPGRLALAQDTAFVGVGSTRAEFEQRFGSGTEIDAGSRLWEYPNPTLSEGFVLLVGYQLNTEAPDSDEYVGSIEFGFDALEGGGATRDEALGQLLGMMPANVNDVESFRISAPNATAASYGIVHWTTSGDDGSRYTASILTWLEEVLVDGETRVVRASVVRERPGAPAYAPNAGAGGLGLTRPEWEDTFGEGRATQAGTEYPNVTLEDIESSVTVDFGGPDGTITNLALSYEEGVTDAGLSGQGSTFIPEDAMFRGEFMLPPTPGGPIGIAIVLWESEALGAALANSGTALEVTMLTYPEGEGLGHTRYVERIHVLSAE